MKNVIKNRNVWFPKKIYEMRKKFSKQNYSSQEDIQIYIRPFFVRHIVFVLIVKNVIENEEFHFEPNFCVMRKNC